jgi:carbohydrate kinase (thermoresistant glucokinase family)
MIVVVMGVSGSGKTTVGKLLAERLGCEFLDGDDHHPAGNVAKMAAGTPLSDSDRWPWLERLNALLRERHDAVLACSALKQAYRERLAEGLEHCEFVHLRGSFELIRKRLESRRHRYMPATLLQSQFDTLEPPPDAIEVDVAQLPGDCVDAALAALAARGVK